MLSRTCGSLTRRARHSAASDGFPAACREPLLFLYPCLFVPRRHRRQQPIRPNIQSATITSASAAAYPPFVPDPNALSNRRRGAPAVDEHTNSFDLPIIEYAVDVPDWFPLWGKDYIDNLNRHMSNLAPMRWTPRNLETEPRDKQQLWIDTVDEDNSGELVDLHRVYPFAFTDSRHNLPPGLRQDERVAGSKRAIDRWSNSREATIQEFRRTMRIVKLLLKLRNQQPVKNAHYEAEEVILVPEVVLVRKYGSEFENLVDLALGHGCRVRVLNRKHLDPHGQRKLVLAGTARAVRLARDIILKQVEDAEKRSRAMRTRPSTPQLPYPKLQVPFVPFVPPSKGHGLVRSVWSQVRRTPDPHNRYLPPQNVPRPSEWNVKTLAEYIEDLSRCCLPQTEPFPTPRQESRFYDQVGRFMLNTLQDPGISKFMSGGAVATMIKFFVNHQKMKVLHDAIPMFDHLVTTRFFNELLRAAARRRDLLLFESYAKLMRAKEVKPNGWEWVQLLKSIRSNRLRSYMLLYLRQLDVLDQPHVVRVAVEVSIQHSFQFHLSSRRSPEVYLDSLQQVFGPCMSPRLINNLVLEAVWAKNPEAIAVIIDYCKRNDLKLDSATLSYAMLYFLETKRFTAGIGFFLDLVVRHRVKRSPQAMQILFMLAWRRRSYNMCRLLWRYCCLEGSVSWQMRLCVFSTLIRNTPADPKTTGELWRKSLGKVVTGIENDLVERPDLVIEPIYGSENRLIPLVAEYTTNGDRRDEQYDLAREILVNDLNASEKYEPLLPLEALLEPAMKLDMEWGHMLKHPPEEQSAEWITSNAIRVPVVRRNLFRNLDERRQARIGKLSLYPTKSKEQSTRSDRWRRRQPDEGPNSMDPWKRWQYIRRRVTMHPEYTDPRPNWKRGMARRGKQLARLPASRLDVHLTVQRRKEENNGRQSSETTTLAPDGSQPADETKPPAKKKRRRRRRRSSPTGPPTSEPVRSDAPEDLQKPIVATQPVLPQPAGDTGKSAEPEKADDESPSPNQQPAPASQASHSSSKTSGDGDQQPSDSSKIGDYTHNFPSALPLARTYDPEDKAAEKSAATGISNAEHEPLPRNPAPLPQTLTSRGPSTASILNEPGQSIIRFYPAEDAPDTEKPPPSFRKIRYVIGDEPGTEKNPLSFRNRRLKPKGGPDTEKHPPSSRNRRLKPKGGPDAEGRPWASVRSYTSVLPVVRRCTQASLVRRCVPLLSTGSIPEPTDTPMTASAVQESQSPGNSSLGPRPSSPAEAEGTAKPAAPTGMMSDNNARHSTPPPKIRHIFRPNDWYPPIIK